jgi:OmpA-OmpF porin, OOP family
MTTIWCTRLGVGILVLLGQLALAQDIKGSSDHPMFSRYPDSRIIFYQTVAFEEHNLATKKQESPRFTELSSLRVDGKYTDIVYEHAPDRSSLEVVNNYKEALAKGGFQTIFECKGISGCGYTSAIKGTRYTGIVVNEDGRYLAAKLTQPKGNVYVSLLASQFGGKLRMRLTVVEAKPMESGLIRYTAQAMSDDIRNTGRAVLYGVLFDTDKTEPTAASAPAVADIAEVLRKDPALKLLVVGHTDKVGTYEYNLNLSQRRADAVVKQLVGQHQINASRLRAVGVGYAAPVATNQTDEGKAKNRRVELVAQ